MGLIKAFSKAVARTVNNANTNRKLDKLQTKTFKETGKQLADARSRGKFVNGSVLYKQNLAKNKRKIEQQHSNREKFINEL